MKTLIAIPCLDMIHTTFFKAIMSLQRVGDVQFGMTCSSLVYDARNILAKRAVREGFDRILWFDSDMDFASDVMKKLSARLDEGLDFCAGIYFSRKAPVKPIVYERVGYYHSEELQEVTPKAVNFIDYPKNALFECEGVGFGIVMHTTEMVKKVIDKFGLPFSPILGFGEDLSFCMRARELGYKLYCDSAIKAGHIGSGVITEELYLAGLGGMKGNGTN